MTTTLTITDATVIDRFRQCKGAHKQREVLEKAFSDKSIGTLRVANLKSFRLNTPKKVVEVNVNIELREDSAKTYSEQLSRRLGTILTPVKPIPYWARGL